MFKKLRLWIKRNVPPGTSLWKAVLFEHRIPLRYQCRGFMNCLIKDPFYPIYLGAKRLLGEKQVKIPVIMCMYKRIERLSKTMNMLDHQKGVDVEFYIWNNNREYEKERIKKIIKKFKTKTEIYMSKKNIGGVGRFYMAKKLFDSKGYSGPVIFIDDDADFDDFAFFRMIKEYSPGTVLSFFAFRFNTSYGDRDMVKPGKNVHYVGTGGMIVNNEVFQDKDFFEEFEKLPRKYRFVEDLWLCYWANSKLGWKLKKSNALFYIEMDDKEQCRWVGKYKNEFLDFLIKRGWVLENFK